jgi:hypothetical protein
MELKYKQLNLVCLVDNKRISIDERSTRLSNFLNNLKEEYQDSDLLVPEIPGEYMEYIADFLNTYKDHEPVNVQKPLKKFSISESYGKWDEDYISKFNKQTLFNLMSHAHFIDCQSLIELASSQVAVMIKDLTETEIQEFFGLENDLTDEEAKRMQEEFEKEKEEEIRLQREKALLEKANIQYKDEL